jgi:hypothetical protein
MNAKARIAQRCHARFRPLAYAARSMPRGNIGSTPERGAEVYADRSGSHQTRSGHVSASDPAWFLIKARVCSILEPWDPTAGGPDPIRGGPDPILGVRSVHVGVQTVYPGVRHFPMGSGLTVDALEYITFSGHVVAPDPPMWRGQALLLAQSSRPRLGRVMAWSHIQLFYHATKDSRVSLVAWVLRLYTIAIGTLVLGYRHILLY